MTTTTSAPTGTPTTPPPEHPDAQQLASFLEGRLTGEVKARVVAHLARCTDCAEVFADAAAFQAEDEGWEEQEDRRGDTGKEDRADNVLRFPRSPRFWTLGALVAAGLTVLLLQTPALQWIAGSSMPSPPDRAELDALQLRHDWNTTRSGSGSANAIMNRQTAFRLGVRLVELDWEYQQGETHETAVAWQDVHNFVGPLRDTGSLRSKLEELQTLKAGVQAIKDQLAPSLVDAFDYGYWTAWAHLASHRKEPRHLLAYEEYLYRVATLARLDGIDLDEATLDDLRSDSPSQETWQALRDAIRITLDEGPGDAP